MFRVHSLGRFEGELGDDRHYIGEGDLGSQCVTMVDNGHFGTVPDVNCNTKEKRSDNGV
jgi:hypothetical protein